MFQCLGLATEQEGGCGEDWWHPECVLGLGRGWSHEESRTRSTSNLDDSSPVHDVGESSESVHPLPPGFPPENDFEAFICYKCVSTNQWIKRYAGSAGFLNPVFKHRSTEHSNLTKIHKPSNDPEGSRTRLSEDHQNGEQTLPNHKEDEER